LAFVGDYVSEVAVAVRKDLIKPTSNSDSAKLPSVVPRFFLGSRGARSTKRSGLYRQNAVHEMGAVFFRLKSRNALNDFFTAGSLHRSLAVPNDFHFGGRRAWRNGPRRGFKKLPNARGANRLQNESHGVLVAGVAFKIE